jgi:hypothetical protein
VALHKEARVADVAVAALRRVAVDHHNALLRATQTFAASLSIPSPLHDLPHPLSVLSGGNSTADVPGFNLS